MNITIRAYTDQDWPAICAIHDAARPIELSGVPMIEPFTPMSKAAHEEFFFDSDCFVAEIDGRVVGFVAVDGAELTWLYVHPDLHRQGIGTRLAEIVMPMLGNDGFVYCVGGNPAARHLYEKMGFELAAEFPSRVQGAPCTCLRLALPTSQYRRRPPDPTEAALELAGYSADNWGKAVWLEKEAKWVWRP